METPETVPSAPGRPGPPPSSTVVLVPGSRFHGDGVRYKAKLIGIDHVTDAEGEKMCWDSMMKLKGLEAAFRKQGRHKQRVWLKICSGGVRILDERTGGEMYSHEKTEISAVTRDESDPRALAYVYKHSDNYYLFYLRMANLAEPVVNDLGEVCRTTDQEPTQEAPPEAPQSSALLVLEDASSPPSEEAPLETVFSPRPDASSQSTQASSSSELLQVFSAQMKDPIAPDVSPSAPEPVSEPPKPALSKTQILSMFTPPPGGALYPPSPWAQQGGVAGHQWAGAMGVAPAAPWPPVPGNVPAWPSAAPPTGHPMNSAPSQGNTNGPQTLNAPPASNTNLLL